jgi:hypothetical protein
MRFHGAAPQSLIVYTELSQADIDRVQVRKLFLAGS